MWEWPGDEATACTLVLSYNAANESGCGQCATDGYTIRFIDLPTCDDYSKNVDYD
jgi:hypothetical protein